MRSISRTVALAWKGALAAGAVGVAALLVWQAFASGGHPDPLTSNTTPGVASIDIAILVFREGLESILVLAAITASMIGVDRSYRRPVAVGSVVALGATCVTWLVAVRVIGSLTESIPALYVQAATGLLAVVVLLIVMNWFFHKVYWTGWISAHTTKKRRLLRSATAPQTSRARLWLGLALLGFTSVYREGVEVVLFLQSYRLRLGPDPVRAGVSLGLVLTAIVAVLTFIAHRRLPYRRMLVATGVMLGVVLLVMVGEQAQEMQLAGWLPVTDLPRLHAWAPAWASLWLSVFPTAETLMAQAVAAAIVLGSYFVSGSGKSRPVTGGSAAPVGALHAAPRNSQARL